MLFYWLAVDLSCSNLSLTVCYSKKNLKTHYYGEIKTNLLYELSENVTFFLLDVLTKCIASGYMPGYRIHQFFVVFYYHSNALIFVYE